MKSQRIKNNMTSSYSKSDLSANAVEFVNISKSFGLFQANKNISFKVRPGTIHAIIGENGAGKSTAMKLLFGMIKQDDGDIYIHGEKLYPQSPLMEQIGMVHQHFMLVESMSVLDNIILGQEYRFKRNFIQTISRSKARRQIEALCKNYGFELPLNKPIKNLSVNLKQKVEILKLLFRHANILIFDEPTAVITPQEAEQLYLDLLRLKQEGKTILIVTHKLKEVLTYCDHVTVFRSGEVTGQTDVKSTNEQRLSEMMVGRIISSSLERDDVNQSQHLPIVTFDNFSLWKKSSHKPLLHKIQLSVKPGEVVGIAGIEGNGQRELVNAILGNLMSGDKSKGEIKVFDQAPSFEIMDQRIGYIPEDRHTEGLALEMSIEENYILGQEKEKKFAWKNFFINRKSIVEKLTFDIQKYEIKARDHKQKVKTLSGGNQQKIIIARELMKPLKLLIASNPTRGVDIGAIDIIHKQIIKERNQGAGVILLSSELDEILKLSDRICVIFEGQIVAHFLKHEANEHLLGMAMCQGASF